MDPANSNSEDQSHPADSASGSNTEAASGQADEAAKNGAKVEKEPPFPVIQRHFPRIADAIELMWGNRELDDYLNRLIMDDRGDRAGFPAEVLAALLALYNQHSNQFKFKDRLDEWAEEDRIDRVKQAKPPADRGKR